MGTFSRVAGGTGEVETDDAVGVVVGAGADGVGGAENCDQWLIEGGGDVLSQALDARVIDKVQFYLGPILAGGPVIAFPGRGAEAATNALRLRCVSYRQIGESICIMAYAENSQSE